MTRRNSACILVLSLLMAGGLQAAGSEDKEAALHQAIDSRSAEDKARDPARHPHETLVFFQVEPGMTVAEALPGGGWYTNILANYLGADGALYGINYPDRMWAMFPNVTEEWIEEHKASTAQFPDLVSGFTDNGIETAGFTFNETFVHWFPNFGFSFLLLASILVLHLIGEKMAAAIQPVFIGTTFVCLLLLSIYGAGGGTEIQTISAEPPFLSIIPLTAATLVLFLGYDPVNGQATMQNRPHYWGAVGTACLLFAF